jgi:nicotinate-nucleotide adenylyltransferase
MAIGLLGGVFDPPHTGHVALARAALEQLDLDSLLVLVVADPGHKHATTRPETRLELARLAFQGLANVEVELDPHSRTVDSLEARKLDDAVFVLGADEFADLPSWKSPERVLELVRLAVAKRPGIPDERLHQAAQRLSAPERVTFFELEPHAVSSSEVRARVSRGEPIDGLVPPAVVDAIRRFGLYGAPEYTATEEERTQTD